MLKRFKILKSDPHETVELLLKQKGFKTDAETREGKATKAIADDKGLSKIVKLIEQQERNVMTFIMHPYHTILPKLIYKCKTILTLKWKRYQ